MSHAFRHIEPTWRNYIYYANQASLAGDENMKKLVASYEALPTRERQTVMPDRLCDLSNVAPGDLIAAVAKELWQHKQSESTITASMNHPKVIEQTAFIATNYIDAYKDRELFLRITGSLPDKKGASIVINNSPQTLNANGPAFAGAGGFKPMDAHIIDMGKLLDDPIDTTPVEPFEEANDDSDDVFKDGDDSED